MIKDVQPIIPRANLVHFRLIKRLNRSFLELRLPEEKTLHSRKVGVVRRCVEELLRRVAVSAGHARHRHRELL